MFLWEVRAEHLDSKGGGKVTARGPAGGGLWESGVGERGKGWGWEPVWRAGAVFLRHPANSSPMELPLGPPLCILGPLNPGAPSIHGDACGFGLQGELCNLHHIESYFTGWWNHCNRLIICNIKRITSLNLSVQEKLSFVHNVLEAQSMSNKLWPWGEVGVLDVNLFSKSSETWDSVHYWLCHLQAVWH